MWFLDRLRSTFQKHRDIDYLKNHATDAVGISKLERILVWLEDLQENEHCQGIRREFAIFFKEYIHRKEIVPSELVPEYESFIKHCSELL